MQNRTVRINIGGTIFKCLSETLAVFSDSKLANLNKQMDEFDHENNEYYFDRNPILFAYILDSFRKGAVHIPRDICGTTFKKELEFWNVCPKYVAPCCLEALYRSEDDKATVNLLVESFQQNTNKCLMLQEKLKLRSKLWLFLDEPHYSRAALFWNILISFVVAVTTLTDCLSSMDIFQENFTEPHLTYLDKYAEIVKLNNATLFKLWKTKPQTWLQMANFVCNIILTVELIVCFIVCENRKRFLTRCIPIMTGLGYFLYWISFIIYFNFEHLDSVFVVVVYTLFRNLSIFRLARLVYLTKNVAAFQIICLTLRTSKKELKVLVFLLGILVFVFAFLFYSAELFHNSKITNVFVAVYWALITLTTVGYGDVVPETAVGHVISCACAVCGVIVLALPVGIIVSKFYKYYDFHEITSKHAKTSPQTLQNKTDIE